MVLKVSLNTGINRIRLEFKAVSVLIRAYPRIRINRIRLEFKDCMPFVLIPRLPVLIESDWNLKNTEYV